MTKVYIWEMDSVMGRKLDEIKEFTSYDQAELFVNDYNSFNDKDTVPEWYMYAEIQE